MALIIVLEAEKALALVKAAGRADLAERISLRLERMRAAQRGETPE